jgi:hypothetical protein
MVEGEVGDLESSHARNPRVTSTIPAPAIHVFMVFVGAQETTVAPTLLQHAVHAAPPVRVGVLRNLPQQLPDRS